MNGFAVRSFAHPTRELHWHRYEHAHGKKKTAGSAKLRVILHKFNHTSPDRSAASWGPVFTGQNAPELSQQEEKMRDKILVGGMGLLRAQDLETV